MIARDPTNAEVWLLNLPPTRQQRRWVIVVALCQFAALVLTAPFAGIPLGQMNGFIPAVESVVFVTDLVTSVLLFSQFAAHRLNALLVLACGYLLSALIIIPHALSFPGAFSPVGLPGAGLQTTPWLYWFWHLPFAMALLGYGLMKNEKPEPRSARGSSLAIVTRSVALVFVLVCGLVLVAVAAKDSLPTIFADSSRGIPANTLVVYSLPAITILLCLGALVVLWRRRSVLDQWLTIVALSMVLEVVIVVFLSPKRFDVGFYAGRLFSLLTSTTIMIVLLMETIRLYANVARSNEDKVRRLVDANIIGIIIWDIEGRIIDCNDAFLQMVEHERNYIASGSLRWTELTPPEWRATDEQRLMDIKAKGKIEPFEKEYFKKDGTRVPVLIGAATFDESRNQGVAFVVDLTERKRVEEDLQRSEERAVASERLRAVNEIELTRAHRALIDAQRLSRTGSYIADLAANEHYWSEELYRIFEFPSEAKIDINELQAMVHPDDQLSFETALSVARRSGVGPDHYFRIITRSGKVKHLHSVASGVVNSDGRIEIVGALQDVTEQKAAEEALRRSEAFLAKGQALSQTGTFAWNHATEKFIWSDELYRIYEFEPGAQITFERIASRYHPEDKAIIAGVGEQARRGVIDFDYTHRLLMPNGSVKHIHVVAHGNYGKDGQLEYFGGVQDVTQRNLAEEALNKARIELTRMTRVTTLGALTAAIAHEINQPLSGIMTNASTCLRMLNPDSPNVDGARETARRTIRDANRASEIIYRLRALFAGRKISAEMLNLNEAIQEVISLSLTEIQNSRVTLRSDFADDLPSVQCDRIQVQQVLLNLIRNAVEAMRDVDDRPRQLFIRTGKAEPDGVIIAVQDSGSGIDPTHLERVFDPFYTTKAEGLGIGLSVCRTIVETHGGRLWATTGKPHGATFQFTLPDAVQAAIH